MIDLLSDDVPENINYLESLHSSLNKDENFIVKSNNDYQHITYLSKFNQSERTLEEMKKDFKNFDSENFGEDKTVEEKNIEASYLFKKSFKTINQKFIRTNNDIKNFNSVNDNSQFKICMSKTKSKFVPFDIQNLNCELSYTESKSKLENPNTLTSSVVLIKVGHSNPIHLQRIWGSIECLNHFQCVKRSIFPIPLQISTDNMRNSVFAFENPPTTPFINLLAPKTASALLHHFRIPLLWAYQIGCVMNHIKKYNILFLKDPCIDDTFIKDDGSLLLGNQLLEIKKSSEHIESGVNKFAMYFRSLFSSCFNLSRTYLFNTKREDNFVENHQSIVLDGILTVKFPGIQFKAIEIIHKLEGNIHRETSKILTIVNENLVQKVTPTITGKGPLSSRDSFIRKLSLELSGPLPNIVDVSFCSDDFESIQLKGIGIGNVSIKFKFHPKDDDSNPNSSSSANSDDEINFDFQTILFSVIPFPLSTSIYLQEVLHMMEFSCIHRDPSILLQASASKLDVNIYYLHILYK